MVEIYIILIKSLLAPEAAFDFAVTGICIRTKVKKTSKFILSTLIDQYGSVLDLVASEASRKKIE